MGYKPRYTGQKTPPMKAAGAAIGGIALLLCAAGFIVLFSAVNSCQWFNYCAPMEEIKSFFSGGF